ncbi:hypothetical protein F7725_011659 [Dissostichus mawsoni]|uniref:Uncharacterized protein n=1 Tax=Dissostichus mawsoni TaxID=36200 RepID=A0A7J5ZDP3_DISMA|nr:hypothetical protein F7725_011659 [Dissostichus mawsoni]
MRDVEETESNPLPESLLESSGPRLPLLSSSDSPSSSKVSSNWNLSAEIEPLPPPRAEASPVLKDVTVIFLQKLEANSKVVIFQHRGVIVHQGQLRV